MKPLSMGTRLPSPRAHAATSLGGMLWLSVRWGALEWRRWAAPEERGAAGSSSRRWSESHPPHVRGPRLPFPRLSAPTTLTRTTKAPSGRRGPRLPARAGRAEGEGWGAGGARPPFCWGLGRGTAGSSSAAPRRQDPCFPPTASASEQTSSTAALGAERRVSSQGAAAAPRAREGRGGGAPFPRPGPRPWGSQSRRRSGWARGHASQPWAVDATPRPTGHRQGGGGAPSSYCWGGGGGPGVLQGGRGRAGLPVASGLPACSLESALTSSFCIKCPPFKADPAVDSLTDDKTV